MPDAEIDVEQVKQIVRAVLAEERKMRENDEFYIKRKELYDAHRRAMTIFSMLDSAGAVVGRLLVYSLAVGVVLLIAYGMGFRK